MEKNTAIAAKLTMSSDGCSSPVEDEVDLGEWLYAESHCEVLVSDACCFPSMVFLHKPPFQMLSIPFWTSFVKNVHVMNGCSRFCVYLGRSTLECAF